MRVFPEGPSWCFNESAQPFDCAVDCAVVAIDEGQEFTLYDCARRKPELIGHVDVPAGWEYAEALARRLADCDLVLVREKRPDLIAYLTNQGVAIRKLGRNTRSENTGLAAWRAWRGRRMGEAVPVAHRV